MKHKVNDVAVAMQQRDNVTTTTKFNSDNNVTTTTKFFNFVYGKGFISVENIVLENIVYTNTFLLMYLLV